ncbi:MAG: LTA synthase family protein [Ruminococcaceae bacterium]|nr:LTA synthase family protein [Oscillospiraceae bacterium]
MNKDRNTEGRGAFAKRLFSFLFLPLCLIYTEILVKLFAVGRLFDKSLIYLMLFSLSAGAFLSLLCLLAKKELVNRIIRDALLFFVTFVMSVQLFCRRAFEHYYGIGVIADNGAGVLGSFSSSVLKIILTGLPLILLLFLPVIFHAVFGGRLISNRRLSIKEALILLLAAVLLHVGALGLVYGSSEGLVTEKGYYTEHIEINGSSDRFGLFTGIRLDLQKTLFPGLYGRTDTEIGDIIIAEPETESETEAEKETETETESHTEAETERESERESETEAPPIVYEPNIMDIDLEYLRENEKRTALKALHGYFAQKEPSLKNEYTGIFEGKNLIYICAEAFSPYFVSEELTPTLYKLMNGGFVFKNFYQPSWGVSTSDGEYTGLLSLVPKAGINSMYRTRLNDMYFSLGNSFSRLGYTTLAYHNHTHTYYSRHITHPNLGYSAFYGVGSGVEKYTDSMWPRSDLQMMQGSLPQYIDKTPFHVYYMSVSGHGGYSRTGNSVAFKNWDKVKDMPCSDTVKAYIAAQLEFEYAMEHLLEELDKGGILGDTVIVFTCDHYPYGLDKGHEGNAEDYYSELAGKTLERNFELYKNTLVIWSSEMKEPVTVKKPCYSLDILPTLLNLFGIEYDSRLLMGRDILAEGEGLVLFRNFSWITDRGSYNAGTNVFTPKAGAFADADYVKEISQRVKDIVYYSTEVLERNYYAEVIKKP